MQDMAKWFGRRDATHLLHDALLDSSMNEVFLQWQCIMTRDNVEAHALHIFYRCCAPNYKTYMLEPIPLYSIRTIASVPLISHALRCETRHWAQLLRVVDYAHFVLNKFKSLSITL